MSTKIDAPADDITLPAMPEGTFCSELPGYIGYPASDMRAYARAAVAADRIAQAAAVDVGAAPDTVPLPRKEWEELDYWLGRCESKGHLERCSDLIEPYEALCKAIAASATQQGATP